MHQCGSALSDVTSGWSLVVNLGLLMGSPNYAFERTGDVMSQARVRRACYLAPSARLKRVRLAAQRER